MHPLNTVYVLKLALLFLLNVAFGVFILDLALAKAVAFALFLVLGVFVANFVRPSQKVLGEIERMKNIENEIRDKTRKARH